MAMSNIDNPKESEPQQAKKSRPSQSRKKLSVSNWLSIANLFLTVITGIVIALYLHASDQNFQLQLKQRDEEIQKQLIDLQNQSKLALIQVDTEREFALRGFGDVRISVRNNGPAVAKGMRLFICFDQIRYVWAPAINDIDQLSIRLMEASYQYGQQSIKSDCGFKRAGINNDAKLFTIDSLSPNQTITIVAGIPVQLINMQDNPEIREVQRETYIKIPRALIPQNPPLFIEDYVETHVTKYLDEIFTIGSITLTDVSCENCSVQRDLNSQNIRTIIRWDWLDSQIIAENENYTEATFLFSGVYWVPSGFDRFSLRGFDNSAPGSPLYLIVNKTLGDYGQEEFEIEEVIKEAYDAYQP